MAKSRANIAMERKMENNKRETWHYKIGTENIERKQKGK